MRGGRLVTPRAGPRPAFTLIELLVVIVVIGILLVLLLPALAAARSAARSARCSGALSQHGRLITAFAADRRDQAPLAGRLWEHTADLFSREHLDAGLFYYFESGPGSIERPMPFFATLAASSGLEFDTSSRAAMRTQLGYPGTTGPAAAAFFQFTCCPDDATFDPAQVNHLGQHAPAQRPELDRRRRPGRDDLVHDERVGARRIPGPRSAWAKLRLVSPSPRG